MSSTAEELVQKTNGSIATVAAGRLQNALLCPVGRIEDDLRRPPSTFESACFEEDVALRVDGRKSGPRRAHPRRWRRVRGHPRSRRRRAPARRSEARATVTRWRTTSSAPRRGPQRAAVAEEEFRRTQPHRRLVLAVARRRRFVPPRVRRRSWGLRSTMRLKNASDFVSKSSIASRKGSQLQPVDVRPFAMASTFSPLEAAIKALPPLPVPARQYALTIVFATSSSATTRFRPRALRPRHP